jgi:putative transposase
MACSGPPTNGLIFHSDRGSQDASGDFQKQRVTFGMKSSMRRKGDCWDNAVVAETLFGSLKVERLHGLRFATRRQAKGRGDRLASVLQSPEASLELGYLSPIAFEKKRLADKEWLVA